MIEFHYCPTPNCWKIAIMLEEIGYPYEIRPYDIFRGEQLVPAFRRLNPNNKLPVIVDTEPLGGGAPVTVFESGAILFYLAEKSGRFLALDVHERMATMEWLAWQIAGFGPMLGQASHFVRYAPEPHPYSIARYMNECRRLAHVLEYRLRESDYLARDYSIADMAIWPWAKFLPLLDIDMGEFPQIQRWFAQVEARPAVERVFLDQRTAIDPTYVQEQRRLTDEEWANTYGEKMLAAARMVPE
jgi:GST-like protein